MKGFSLISEMVACVILAIGVLAIINLFPIQSTVNARADRMEEAAVLCEDKIEEFRSIGFDALKDTITAGYNTGSETFGLITRNWTLIDSGNFIQIIVESTYPVPRSISNNTIKFVTQVSDHE